MTMTQQQQKRRIIRVCKSRGWTVHPDVLPDLQDFGFDFVQTTLLPALATCQGRCITPDVWQDFMHNQDDRKGDKSGKDKEGGGRFEVVSAFAAPNIVYEEHRKLFRAAERKGHILGTAQDKVRPSSMETILLFESMYFSAHYVFSQVDMLLRRYHWLHQRVLSHHLFRPTKLHERPHTLTPIARLLGAKSSHQMVLLLAIVVRTSDTEWALEDTTGQVDADLSKCLSQDTLITEHSIILVEGTFHNDVFTIHHLREPLHDDQNRLSISNLPPSSPVENLPITVAVHGTTHFQQVLAREQPDILIVLLRNKTEIADVANFTTATTTIVAVPPPHRSVWPNPPCSSTATNPCNIQYDGGRTTLIALNDTRIQQHWHASAILSPTQAAPWWRTAIDQGVLFPPATTPVYWSCQPRLYPIPQLLVVASGAVQSSTVDFYEGCHVLQLGIGEQGMSNDTVEYGIFDEDDDRWRICTM